MIRTFLVISVISNAICCFSQSTASVQVKVVRSAPFSAIATTEIRQVLADGSQVTKTVNATLARDSEGRTRREQALPNGGSIVFLEDPVLGYGFVIDMSKKAARRFIMSTTGQNGTSTEAAGGTSLGSQVIEGLPVDGTRLTRTMGIGAIGNEHPFDVTVEAWYSADLQTVLLRKTTDPRTGETIYKVTSIDRNEPDPALFQMPAGFAIHEDTVVAK
jgi:hypothetical protein